MKKLLSRFVTLVIIFAVALAAWELYFRKPAGTAPTKPITVTSEMTVSELAQALKDASIVSSASLFATIAQLTGEAKKLQPGVFIFKEGMSVADVLQVLNFIGKKEITVTIPEGLNLRQVADRFLVAGLMKTKENFFAVSGMPAAQPAVIPAALVAAYPFLAEKPADVSLEGYLFPDTYRFYENATAEDIVRRMLDTYGKKVADLKMTHAALTVASILEEEVTSDTDRALVADIMYRRLSAGIPLQMDSTINYVTGKSVASVSHDDLTTNSSWNTYKYKGLPPGPISNPGVSAMRAALAPTPNAYWYFLTTKEGKVIYSKTSAEHATAKAKYLK